MNNKVFGDVKFNLGWETSLQIRYNEKDYTITVSADAYFETDGITQRQEDSYAEFLRNKVEVLKTIENALGDNAKFVPTLLLVKRNGDYGLVFDDIEDTEGGAVVTVKPEIEVLSVDQYF